MKYSTIQKYSEEHYYSKEECRADFNDSTLSILWNEIEAYRALFRHEIHVNKQTYYVTYNPYLYHKIIVLHQNLNELQHRGKEEIVWLSLSETERKILNHFYVIYNGDSQVNPLLIVNALKAFHLNLDQELLTILLTEKEDIFLKVFLCILFLNKKEAILVINIICSKISFSTILKAIDIDFLYQTLIKDKECFDLTYLFLVFLNQIHRNLSKMVLILEKQSLDKTIFMNREELHHLYPMLHHLQIDFYLSHKQSNHFYDIKDYQESSHVCYETARSSLEQFVALHFYQKLKVGNKFVYYIV
ncbi:MAG: hypothetical protein RSA96_01145 [Erysipelotrichaceae bacterium]